jgi:alkanesulfonate monooxygenase SsuD/methylene tetrahydromethanopterin reductase-like flavin-dependent oxidoreductase (luciferase family)
MHLGLEIRLSAATLGAGEPALLEQLFSAIGEAERVGFHALWLNDDESGGVDAAAIGGAVAARTTTLAVGIVAAVPRRHPAMLARELITLDLLSGGRVAVRLHDIEAVAHPQRLAEAVALTKLFLSAEEVNFSGEYFTVATGRPALQPSRRAPVVLVDVNEDSAEIADAAPAALVRSGDLEELQTRAPLDRSTVPELWRCHVSSEPRFAARVAETLQGTGFAGVIWRLPDEVVPSVEVVRDLGETTRNILGQSAP